MNKSKIIILCGGRGKRLGEITKVIPKSLVKINNKSILEYKLKTYKKQGFNNFIFCTGYMGNKIEKELERLDINGKISNAGEKAGILKRIFFTNDLSSSSIISYGDTYAEIDFNDLIINHKKSRSLITLVISSIRHPFGLIQIREDNKVVSFKEKPLLNHYIGYAVMDKKIFNIIPKSYIDMPDGMGLVKAIKYLIKLDKVNTYKFDGLKITINTTEELKAAKERIGNYYTLNEKF